MTFFAVEVENSLGLRAIHYVKAVFPSTAREEEEQKGYTVLQVREWGNNKKFINLPGYEGQK